MLTVGDKFPQFSARACTGNGKDDFTTLTNEYQKGKWGVYFFYPKDFTFICPTEIVEFNKKLKDFKDRDAVVVGGSTDNEYSHQAWRKAHADLGNLQLPLIAAQRLADDLRILDPAENVCLRATYIVDPDGVIQWVSANSLNVGRSVPEVLRVLDAVQSDELCPCNWQKGQPTLKV
ncbi:MAG: peroxiredoxin [Gemmataceae bacterium]|nr:peroxiredoxin [Gemmataceae bacterium]